MIDDTTDSGDTFRWTSATTTGDFISYAGTNNFTFTVNGTSWHPITPDKNWMPNRHFEYIPKWHKKFASYKLQMQSMWD